jgi:hypothetical protein
MESGLATQGVTVPALYPDKRGNGRAYLAKIPDFNWPCGRHGITGFLSLKDDFWFYGGNERGN